MRLVGHPEVIGEPWFRSGSGRVIHADLLDTFVGDWIGRYTQDEVLAAFEEAGAAVAPIYDISQVMADPQYQALESIVSVDDPDLGPLKMQNMLFRLGDSPGSIAFAGRRLGQDNDHVYGELLGLSSKQQAALRDKGVI
jgi:crotonobetainyl-CoA:carnitine CoA-transferase CaiB-like acyl-CoA transferase